MTKAELARLADEMGLKELGSRPGREFLSRAGEPITMREWAAGMANREYVILERSYVGPYYVSTVWLGFDHGYGFGRPVIFESMVFRTETATRTYELDGVERSYEYHPDYDQRRYCTEEEARAGHEELCNEVRLMVEAMPEGYVPEEE